MALRRFLSIPILLTAVLCLVSGSRAQSTRDKQQIPIIEVFAGYSNYHPGGSVNGTKVPNFTNGWAGQVLLNCNPKMAFAIDVNGHYNSYGSAHDFAVGPQFKKRWGPLTPFGEALVGVQGFSPKQLPSQNSATYIFGGGLDVRVTRRVSIRPFQIDFVSTYYNGGEFKRTNNLFNGFRGNSGLVFNFGQPEPPQPVVEASCVSDPTAVDAGAPVKISTTPKGFPDNRKLNYAYSTTGGTVTGNARVASLDTTGLAPGEYTVTAQITDNHRRPHALAASCQSTVAINKPPDFHPTLAVKVDPASVVAGNPLTLTVSGSSPDNHPLNYQCTASAGSLTGSGTNFTLDTAGVPEGAVSVNCTVTDDRTLTASTTTSVQVHLPTPVPSASKFGNIEFKRDTLRPTRVDNQAKGALDRYGDALAAAPDAKAVIVGFATAQEVVSKKQAENQPRVHTDIAAQRVINTKDYLVRAKGIDAARIEPRTSSTEGQKVQLWMVLPGATAPVQDTYAVDETIVKAVPRVPLKPVVKKDHRKPKQSPKAARSVAHKKPHKSINNKRKGA